MRLVLPLFLLLLSASCCYTGSAGVTEASMLSRKVLSELIEPIEVRIENVRRFLATVDPSLELKVPA